MTEDTRTAFRELPFMGVIRVNNEAAKVGYRMGDPGWSNLGQGQPEVGELAGAPPRYGELKIDPADHAYGPVEGIPELRDGIAAHYNRLYRAGKASQYTRENIAVAPGGRAALTRLGAALAPGRLGYFTPDYTAYEDLLTAFGTTRPVQFELRPEAGFRVSVQDLQNRVVSQDVRALLISNPCNPTGVAVAGDELRGWLEMARRQRVTLLMDEFYSHYAYLADGGPAPATSGVSAAAYVEDVNADPVVLVDGLTKCFRYPGWRVGWVVGPRDVIQRVTAAGSFLDGGPSRPIQRAAIEVLEPARADQEIRAVRAAFALKRKLTLDSLSRLGVVFPSGAGPGMCGTFYLFGDVRKLPAPMNTGEGFMREAFKHRVLTIPGEFFDVNPGRTRQGASPLGSFVRFSFGPPKDNLAAGLERLGAMVRGAR